MPYRDKDRQREFQRQWVASKKLGNPAFASVIRERESRNLELRRDFVNGIKASLKCHFCGERNPARLEFHHIDGRRKVASVSAMVAGRYALPRIVAEMCVCVCVCRNHHMDLTNLMHDYCNKRDRTKASRTTAERKAREHYREAARNYVLASHPNVLFEGETVGLLRHLLGS